MRPSIPALVILLVAATVMVASQAAVAQTAAPAKADALLLYRQGRDLEGSGRSQEAQAKFTESVEICDRELATDPRRLEAYVVKCWSLFRLGKHQDVISTGQTALKLQFDARTAEVMGESYYHLGQMQDSLKYLQKYVEAAGESGDRVPTAYFYMGEGYLRLKKYSHADMAYTTAVAREPNMPRWWYRLGGACEALGEWSRAFEAYGKAINLVPTYPEALEAQARVKQKLP